MHSPASLPGLGQCPTAAPSSCAEKLLAPRATAGGEPVALGFPFLLLMTWFWASPFVSEGTHKHIPCGMRAVRSLGAPRSVQLHPGAPRFPGGDWDALGSPRTGLAQGELLLALPRGHASGGRCFPRAGRGGGRKGCSPPPLGPRCRS